MGGFPDDMTPAFTRRYPGLARLAASAPGSADIHDARSGAKTGSVDGVRLCSEYDPAKEAARFAAASGASAGDHVALYGLGLGHHIGPILDAIGPEGRMVVAEANLSILKAALDALGDPEILADERITVVSGASEEEILPAWSRAFIALDPARTVVLIHEPSFRLIPEGYGKIRNAIELIRMERRFPALLGGVEMDNFRANLPTALRSEGVASLAGAIEGGVAAVVGGGPSLDRVMPYLGPPGAMTVLSTDTAAPALLANGVTPDLVFTVDPQPGSAVHFRLAGRRDLPLALTPTANPEIVAGWQGPMFFGFSRPERFPEPARGWAAGRGVFRHGGSVTLFALETALAMGAATVYLAGVDLAFPNGRKYASGAAPAIMDAPDIPPDELVAVNDYFGRQVMAKRNLYAYRLDIETIARSTAAEIYTLSPEGARIDGVEAVPSPPPRIGKGGAASWAARQNAPTPAGEGVERAFADWLDERAHGRR